ncbi:hypothetical protein GPALN_012962 [Globodera pallida]|nr:hypothetical protein GPALN_012962 [Globodera pallida]
MSDSIGGICRSHLCRSQSATNVPESWADRPYSKLTRVHSTTDIAQRYADINSPTRYWPKNKPYYWPMTSNLCNIVSNYNFYPLFRSYSPSYRSYLLDTNWYNRRFDRFQFMPPDSHYNYWPTSCSYHYWYHYPYFKRWHLGTLGGVSQFHRQ